MLVVLLKFEYAVWVGKANRMLIFLPCNCPIPMGAHQFLPQGWCPTECEFSLTPQCDGVTVGGHDCVVIIDNLSEVSVLVKQDSFPQAIWECGSLPSSLDTPEGILVLSAVNFLEQPVL